MPENPGVCQRAFSMEAERPVHAFAEGSSRLASMERDPRTSRSVLECASRHPPLGSREPGMPWTDPRASPSAESASSATNPLRPPGANREQHRAGANHNPQSAPRPRIRSGLRFIRTHRSWFSARNRRRGRHGMTGWRQRRDARCHVARPQSVGRKERRIKRRGQQPPHRHNAWIRAPSASLTFVAFRSFRPVPLVSAQRFHR